jgi:hypothetical protein
MVEASDFRGRGEKRGKVKREYLPCRSGRFVYQFDTVFAPFVEDMSRLL